MKRTMQGWFDAYSEHHQNGTNKLIHWICVPLIFFCVIGLLAAVPIGIGNTIGPAWAQPYLHLGTLVVVLGLLFYVRLSVPIALGMLVVCAAALMAVAAIKSAGLPLALICLVTFVAAWVGQFVGHKIEGAKPSFLDDLQFLLIGPAWLLGFVFRAVGIRY